MFSVAAPLSAVGAAGFSVLAGLLLGERPIGLALIGIVLALPAIVGVSVSARARPGAPRLRAGRCRWAGRYRCRAGAAWCEDAPADPAAVRRRFAPAGVSYGLIAGACFALLFIGLNRAGSGSGLWPVFCSQTDRPGHHHLRGRGHPGPSACPTGRSRWLAGLAGLGSGPGTILYFVATHHGQLAVAAVISSLYPAVTIMLARVLLGERLTASGWRAGARRGLRRADRGRRRPVRPAADASGHSGARLLTLEPPRPAPGQPSGRP